VGGEMWGKLGEVCEFGTLGGLPEASDKYPNFDRINLLL
jgi:hypothetical protein